MPKVQLYRIERADLNDCWKDEPGDFTPWLANAENIQLIADLLDLNLEVVRSEAPAGRFFVDILCKDVDTGNYVIIENQFSQSDHKHLGQILTYAGVLDASVLVWIAPSFNNEHKAALEWLNRYTNESVRIFAFAIRMIRIGDKHALDFEPIVTPNTWAKRLKAAADEASAESDLRDLKSEYWAAFKEYAESRGLVDCPAPSHHTNIKFRSIVAGIRITAIANVQWSTVSDDALPGIRVQLSFESDEALRLYEQLSMKRPQIDTEYGEELTWYSVENTRRRRIYVKNSVDIRDKNEWSSQHKWLFENVQKFGSILVPWLRSLALKE